MPERKEVVAEFISFLLGQGDVESVVNEPPLAFARIYNSPDTLVRVEIDPDVLLRNHPKLSGTRADFLDAASALSVSLFEVLVFEAIPETIVRLDPSGAGFLASPRRSPRAPVGVSAAPTPLRPDRHLSPTAVATYVIDGTSIHSAPAFYRAVGEAVNGAGGYFGGSLDGLNDCLGGGMGAADGEIQFRWLHSHVARSHLGYAQTVRTMRASADRAAYVNRRAAREELLLAELGLGPTIFDSIVRIFDEAEVNLVLE